MPKASEIQTVYTAAIGADADVGLAVPANMRRYIYQIEATNQFAGANQLTLGKREDGAGATTTIDELQFTLQYDYLPKPDGPLTEDALPLYIIEGPGTTGNSFIRATTDNGPADLIIRYVDAP